MDHPWPVETTVADLTIWHNPRCSKSRGACALIEERRIDADVRRYLEDAPSREEVEEVMRLLGIDDPREMMRVMEPVYAELALDHADRDALIDAMVKNPILIQRPVVIRGDRAVIARPPERLLDLFQG